MRATAYFFCAVLTALPNLFGVLAIALYFFNVQVPFGSLASVFYSFGSIVPAMFSGLLPKPVTLTISLVMLCLAIRRVWLFFAKRERTPASFVGFPKALGYIGFWSFLLGFIAFLLAFAFKLGSGVPAGMLMIPAVFCVPWAFFLTEILSFNKTEAS